MTSPGPTAVPDLSKSHSNSKIAKLLHLATLHGINPDPIINKVESDLEEIHNELHNLFDNHKQG